MLSVHYNPSVLNTQNNLSHATNAVSTALERMSTGYKINRASDDAAGLFIATGLNAQIRGLKQAQKNVNDGLSIISTAESALSNITELLNRIRDLSVQAANSIYDTDSRTAMQAEANALIAEIEQIKKGTNFNGRLLFASPANTIATASWQVNAPTIKTSTTNTTAATATPLATTKITEDEAIAQGYTIIKTAQDLDNIRNNLSGKYILMNDIDLSSISNWDPIGDIDTSTGDITNGFSGILEGNGFAIKNLKINRASEYGVGLFSGIKNAKIQNLTIDNVNVSGGFAVGGLAAIIINSDIVNVNISGSITGQSYIGGLAGVIGDISSTLKDNSNISYSSSSCNITASFVYSHAGSLAGASLANINNCFATGNVSGNAYLGGLVGSAACEINNCFATGNVTGNELLGGIAGMLAGKATISYCYATGKIVGNQSTGGLVGGTDTSSVTTIKNSFFDTQKTGQNNVLGLDVGNNTIYNAYGLTSSEMQNPSNWNGWDPDIWDFSTYPPTLKDMPTGGTNPPDPPDPPDPDDPNTNDSGNIRLQVGANADPLANAIYFDTTFDFDGFTVDFSTADSAAASIDTVDNLLAEISKKTSEFGAIMNRLDGILQAQITQIENFTAAKSTIMDADIASESAEYVRNQILQQTSSTLLTQAQNVNSSVILALLR